jgi:hypothetical protein
MAINIYSGSSRSSGKPVNSASSSTRAQAAKAALGGNAVASDSGNTAVKSPGILGKAGNLIGNVAGIASKFLPGAYGTVAGLLADTLNDPEWWQSVPGEQITLNTPLIVASAGTDGDNGRKIFNLRPAIAEFTAMGTGQDYDVVLPTDKMITQYLMPEIRKVVNAVPLQAASSYSAVLKAHASAYAAWRTLKKYDYLLKHGQTYLPNMNVALFPLLRVENAAWLQSTINRIEEYLRANVRIPHTLCEYLAWRYGRIYKSVDSQKAALIMYNFLPLTSSVDAWNNALASLMAVPTATEENQKANADLYNSYFDHDLMVEIRDDTQLRYDPKEFALRTNLDVKATGRNFKEIPVYLDSKLDNATVFMASTVSTYALDESGVPAVLFPVRALNVYTHSAAPLYHVSNPEGDRLAFASGWSKNSIYEALINDKYSPSVLIWIGLLKACDVYNKNIYVPVMTSESASDYDLLDITSLSCDSAITTDTVINNEQVFAFANLVDVRRKRSTSMAQAEREVAGEVANLVDKIDVASAATTSTK